jgi:prepilin-type N-terminal cleavage/methylation domain-containing protein
MLVSALVRLRRRLAAEDGFTLVEMLTAMTIGTIVTFAAVALLGRAFVATNEVSDRVDAAQRGRVAMDTVTRELGSMVCFSGITPIVAGSNSSITFVTDLGNGSVSPERHVLTFAANGTLTDAVYAMTSVNGATPVTWAATPSSTRTLLTGGAQNATTPFFQYLGYDSSTSPPTTPALNSPLVTADLDNVTQIVVSFSVLPAHSSTSAIRGAALTEQVAVPEADPNLTDPNKTTVSQTC